MQKTSLTALARHELEAASRAPSGRSAKTIYGGHEHQLRQTLIALRAGRSLGEYENPGEGTLQVIVGRVLLRCGGDSWSGWNADVIVLPPAPHSVEAVEDAVVLLTVVKSR